MNYAKPLLGMVALASLTLTACMAPGEVESETGTAHEAATTDNGLTQNGLTQNGLTQNGLTQNGLTQNGLTQNGLTQNGLTQNGLTQNGLTQNGLVMAALTDANSRAVLKYIVGCALPATADIELTVQGVNYSYHGQLGLAPEWGQTGGVCGKECQGWVSACVLARVDYLGELEEISVRGLNPALATTRLERFTYNDREATYYGNIFTSPQQRYACLSPGKTEIPRVCGPSIQGCVMDVVGSCEDLCGTVRPDGAFPACWNKMGGAGAVEFDGSITVFLKP